MKIRINDDLREVGNVRLMDATGKMLGIISADEALRLARSGGFDLVEVNPRANPPLCRLMNFAKFRKPVRS